MGSKYSQSNTEDTKQNDKKIKTINKNKNYISETEDISIKLETKENTDNSSITTATDRVDNTHQGQELVPFTFEWKEGDHSQVILTGTFLNNWSTYVSMTKNKQTGIFEKTLFLPRAKHEFKFIIGNNWVCSDQYPTVPNQYNGLNNFIDLTNAIYPENKIIRKKNNEDNNNKIEIEENNNINVDNAKKAKKIYNSRYPHITEMNNTAPCIIHHYRPQFDIDYQSRQIFISLKKKESFQYKEKNINTENNTFKKIMIWPHEKLLHACPNLGNLYEDNDNYYRISSTQRNKHKYLTIVYYKPKKDI